MSGDPDRAEGGADSPSTAAAGHDVAAWTDPAGAGETAPTVGVAGEGVAGEVVLPAGLSAEARQLLGLSERAAALAQQSRSRATDDAYASDWAGFAAWCDTAGVAALPAAAASVANYLADCAPSWRAATDDEIARGGQRLDGARYRDGAKPATLRRRLVAIRDKHRRAGLADPTTHLAVRRVLAGIARSEAAAGRRVAAAATERPLRAMLATTVPDDPALETAGVLGELRLDDPRDARGAAILTLGMTGALRRSELAALTVGDVEFVQSEFGPGLLVSLRRSKTDQEAQGHGVDIPAVGGPACPMLALHRWLGWLEVPYGATRARLRADGATPLWRRIRRGPHDEPRARITDAALGARSVAEVVKQRAAAAGLEGRWSGHSLRRGFATGAYAAGADEVEIMRHGRWRSAAVMRDYLAEGTRFRPTHAVHRLFDPDSSERGHTASGRGGPGI